MRKIPRHLENPIDDTLLLLTDIINPYFYKLGFTPNHITTLSLIFGILSIYYFYKEKFIVSGIMYFISYFFDCADGHYARTYKMVTKFGDYYDHVKDVSITSIMLYLIFRYHIKNKSKNIILYMIVITILSILMMQHFGCQEKYYKNDVDTLKHFKKYCNTHDVENKIKYTRFIGSGTLILIVSLFIAFTPFFVSLDKLLF